MFLPSGTEEYFNKKKTLNTKCWGVRAIALPSLTVLKNYSSCIIIYRTYARALHPVRANGIRPYIWCFKD